MLSFKEKKKSYLNVSFFFLYVQVFILRDDKCTYILFLFIGNFQVQIQDNSYLNMFKYLSHSY